MEINRVNRTNFKGLNKMKNIEPSFEEQVKILINKLLERSREVAEYGNFKPVYEILPNGNKGLKATDFALRIERPAETEPTLRTLDAVAYRVPLTKRYERTLVSGTKEDILKAMQEEGFAQKVKETFERLSSHFEWVMP